VVNAPRTQVQAGNDIRPPAVRESWPAVLAARRLPMRDRLELALEWNELAAALRAGLSRARRRAT
jgi:hypothetical protein